MTKISKIGYVVLRYSDGFWITFWDNGQERRVKSHGPYKYSHLALIDIEVLNNKRK